MTKNLEVKTVRQLLRNPVRQSLSAVLLFITFANGVLAASIQQVYTHSAFETAGIIVTLSADNNGNESVALEIRNPATGNFEPAHNFVRYDANNFATSLFNLAPGSGYDVRLTLTDPDGVSGSATFNTQIITLAENTTPVASRIITVGASGADFTTIQAAIDTAIPGDEIRVSPGNYNAVSISDVIASAASPIVVRAANPNNRPVIDGGNTAGSAINIQRSAYITFDGFEVRNGGTNGGGAGFRLQASAHITLRNNYIHDNGRYNVFITQSNSYPSGATAGGYHLIEDNIIADENYTPCNTSSNSACANQTYYGVRLDNNPGAGNIIHRNVMYGHVDNAAVCGDEGVGAGRSLSENAGNVLALTGGTDNRGWTNHDLDFYDNDLYSAKDDDIEADGICVNARIYRNRFGDAQNPVSIAPALPGPFFFVRNVIDGNWGEAAIKLNTAAASSNIPIRNIFFYHNTVVRNTQGTLLNLWYDVPGDHNVPIKNINFRNNIFWASNGGAATNCNNQGDTHPSFDYNLWYTPDTGSNIFCWWNGTQTLYARNLDEFRLISGQELHGYFTLPGLDAFHVPLTSPGASAAIDAGTPIAGINDNYYGAAPDLGAYELNTGTVPGPPPPVTGPPPPVTGPGTSTVTMTDTSGGGGGISPFLGAILLLLGLFNLRRVRAHTVTV
jgi:hypothetical protein